MTALSEYQRLECSGLWRDAPEGQRRAVIVSFGDATLVISDDRSTRALAHWSLPAVTRANPGKRPALYMPGTEPGEELEIEDDTMIAAIEKVHAILEARRPHPGRLRSVLMGGSLALVLGLGVFWMPGALIGQAASVSPFAKRVEIGEAALADLTTVTGAACHTPEGDRALRKLSDRLLGTGDIVVVPQALKGAVRLPGRIIALGRDMVEDQDTPEVLGGAILATGVVAQTQDPLLSVLHHAGVGAAFQLLTTGDLPAASLRGYGEWLLTQPPLPVAEEPLLAAFAEKGFSSAPYAYAQDPTGESVLGLIEADPLRGAAAPDPLLSDGEWVTLQAICDG
ncbi:hypothetical protein [Phaeovulum sp. W22_SRMD_FR3]|uniref:hypothetical protein n=1 Tax=Phaeovulum sp. W22_SRMD_FR3 TaxID=3240274 RepID=UPI003F9D8E0F